jgi:hypothetical protein
MSVLAAQDALDVGRCEAAVAPVSEAVGANGPGDCGAWRPGWIWSRAGATPGSAARAVFAQKTSSPTPSRFPSLSWNQAARSPRAPLLG